MTLTNSPDLYVNILIGSNNEEVAPDRFAVKCDDAEKLELFFTWWFTVGSVRMAETLAMGKPFYLVDDGAGFEEGSPRVIRSYLVWRDETFAGLEEPVLLAA